MEKKEVCPSPTVNPKRHDARFLCCFVHCHPMSVTIAAMMACTPAGQLAHSGPRCRHPSSDHHHVIFLQPYIISFLVIQPGIEPFCTAWCNTVKSCPCVVA